MFIQSNTLVLADVFNNSRNTCVEMHELDPAPLVTAPALAWKAALKKTYINLNHKKISGEEYVMLFIDGKKLLTNS